MPASMPDLNIDAVLRQVSDMIPDVEQEWTLLKPIVSSQPNWELINYMPKIENGIKSPTNFSLEIDWRGEGDNKGVIRVVLTRGSLMTGETDV